MKKIFKKILSFSLATPILVLPPVTSLTNCSKSFQITKVKSLIELHNHLDGFVTLSEARKLSGALQNELYISDAAKAEVDTTSMSDTELSKLIQVEKNCPSLELFLQKFIFINKLLITENNVRTLAKDACNSLFDQGVIYAELRFAPQFFKNSAAAKGVYKPGREIPTTEAFLKAVIDGVNESKLAGSCGLILVFNRNSSDETEYEELLNLAEQYKNQGVCGLDFACSEAKNPIHEGAENWEFYKKYCDLAKSKNINFTIHAGEAQLPSQDKATGDAVKDINAAIDLGAKRIGHGTYAQYSEETMKRLANEKITLEVCPYSNYMTKGIDKYENHPIKTFIQHNIPICISTDDPGVENETLQEEWQRIINTFSLGKNDIKNILLNTVNACFTTDTKKAELNSKVIADFAKL